MRLFFYAGEPVTTSFSKIFVQNSSIAVFEGAEPGSVVQLIAFTDWRGAAVETPLQLPAGFIDTGAGRHELSVPALGISPGLYTAVVRIEHGGSVAELSEMIVATTRSA